MNYERESWRKLYREEPLEQRAWPLMTRGIRDHLVRHPADLSGILLAETSDPITDIVRALAPHESEVEAARASIELLLKDGYLVFKEGRLWIRNYRKAQTARSKDAERKAKARLARPGTRPGHVRDTSRTRPGHVHAPNVDMSRDIPGDETRRDETRKEIPPNPPKGGTASSARRQKRNRPRTAMTEDWQVPSKLQTWCQEQGLRNHQIASEREGFIDYWLGVGERKADWDATFRGRIRRGLETGRIKPQAEGNSAPVKDDVATADDYSDMALYGRRVEA